MHDVGVSDADGGGMIQDHYVRIAFVLGHKWDHFDNVVVEHEYDESACLSQKDRIRLLFLVI